MHLFPYNWCLILYLVKFNIKALKYFVLKAILYKQDLKIQWLKYPSIHYTLLEKVENFFPWSHFTRRRSGGLWIAMRPWKNTKCSTYYRISCTFQFIKEDEKIRQKWGLMCFPKWINYERGIQKLRPKNSKVKNSRGNPKTKILHLCCTWNQRRKGRNLQS